MGSTGQQKRPGDVFTPRAATVNESMYVRRPKLEERLTDAIDANKYIVIHGESGNGKTWLYKRVFNNAGVHYDTVNLSTVINAGSLEGAFRQKLGEFGVGDKVLEETSSSAGAKPFNVGFEHEYRTGSQFYPKSPFVSLLERIRYRANGKKAALVLDNFEAIINNQEVLSQLAAMIISADDDTVAQFDVKVVIVGVPSNLKETITRLTDSAPVANRLTELPEVARMSETEANDLIYRGFVEELKLAIDDEVIDKLYANIAWYTDRIAQHIHELCLIIAQNAVRNHGVIDERILRKSRNTWIEDSLSSDMAVIESVMNARETKVGRKNQVLFAMGLCKTEDFKYSDIEALVRETFDVANAATLNVSQILSGFADASSPLIRRTPKQDAWRFVSPKLKMAIRTRFKISADGRVDVRP
ncbi:MAG TPA: ATP-binding protein [Allosphingosinicella sp.]|nr:ATP-binding protein [Allosphingosinicella sp.]